MSKTNEQIVREYIEIVGNQKQFDRTFEYCSEDCISSVSPYVGLGINFDDSSGERVILAYVAPNGPAAEFLKAGDELVRVKDDQRTWETFHELKNGMWGQGILDTPITVTVRRDGKLLDLQMKRGRVESLDIKLTQELIEISKKDTLKNWPDIHTDIELIFSQGDLVACLQVNSATNQEYHRSAVWGECDIFRVKNEKIVQMWGCSDSFALFKQLGYQITEPVREAN